MDKVIINKYTEGIAYYYNLNEQEVSGLVKMLKTSKFYQGVSRPDLMVGDKLIDLRVIGGGNPSISIYYDTNKTYVFANISNKRKFNHYYRISNKDEIRIYIEKIIDTRNNEFKKVPSK